ncbi:uncharacterized protein FOMMEDRAFT_158948 [Fomitiporia mediterranea MF3/22]|uniref:uncharacterized protein n=1 Tax=Fomitiporia mediterranea (strain MF3/22) TaxID=694068 RepID=UPI00044091C6|nr:uncharacterized protein FOMMEDRAFT_158948 [Fomitiporia mediterranea MF3/22]EJD00279.1 hypothetical protein FOMMEDRAFT_158948 [Fomitiporia mediterranea MF3/22]
MKNEKQLIASCILTLPLSPSLTHLLPNPHPHIPYSTMYTITFNASVVLLPLESGILPFPLKRDVIETLPRLGRPEYGSEDEGELATLLVSKSVRRISDRLSGVFRRRDRQRGVKVVPSPKVNDVDDVASNNAIMWFTSADNWRPGLLPLEQAARRADIGMFVRQVAPDTNIGTRGEQETGIPFSPLKCDTIDTLPRFGEPEYGFEDEGELATPFVSESVPRLTGRLSGVKVILRVPASLFVAFH